MTLDSVPRYEPGRLSDVGKHAVVIGGSMGGLLAARVLSDGFEEVTLIERDSLPDRPRPRRGVPQSYHPHILWESGRAVLEDLFPGYTEEVILSGGLIIDFLSDVSSFAEGDFYAPGPIHHPTVCASRPLFEHLLRQDVFELDNVTVRTGCHLTGYLSNQSSTAVEGARIQSVDTDHTEEVVADLVIDATGRTSRTPAWLELQDYDLPTIEEVTINAAYSSVRIERPSGDRRGIVMIPAPPLGRGCFVFPIEDDQWFIGLTGVHGERPPVDREGLIEFAGTLPFPDAKQLLDTQSWVSEEIHHYPFPSNRRIRYETLNRFPDDFIVLGDAIASFNPIYGQGMSVAALQALTLHHTLVSEGLETVGMRFFDRVSKVIDPAWTLATGADFRFEATEGIKPRGTDVLNRYLSQLQRKAHTDGSLQTTFMEVVSLQKSPDSLLRPSVAWQVLKPFGW